MAKRDRQARQAEIEHHNKMHEARRFSPLLVYLDRLCETHQQAVERQERARRVRGMICMSAGLAGGAIPYRREY